MYKTLSKHYSTFHTETYAILLVKEINHQRHKSSTYPFAHTHPQKYNYSRKRSFTQLFVQSVGQLVVPDRKDSSKIWPAKYKSILSLRIANQHPNKPQRYIIIYSYLIMVIMVFVNCNWYSPGYKLLIVHSRQLLSQYHVNLLTLKYTHTPFLVSHSSLIPVT